MTAHPSLWLALSALAGAAAPARLRRVLAPVFALLAVAWTLQLTPAAFEILTVSGFRLEVLRVDALRWVFALVFSLAAFLGALYAWNRDDRAEAAAAPLYAGSALAAVLSGDWITLFFCWELMAVTSFLVIWRGGTRRSLAAGLRYLLVHAAGGMALFCGILLHLSAGGDPRVGPVPAESPGFWLMLAGVGLNAAIPPLNAWLTDAYPEASPSGSVYLSAFTTKTAVYVLLSAFAGTEILVPLGVFMALYGVVYAVLENDIRRLLAYHIVSQVGYMVAGAGLGTPLAVNGAAAHAFCHILYKALLFMGAGAVVATTGRRKLTELGGLGARMPLVFALYMVGAFSISGFPLFNGFVSKSMVVSAAGEAGLPWAELLLLLASVGTFLHTGLKLPYYTFLSRPAAGARVQALSPNVYAAMGITALLCFLIGAFPALLYRHLPFAVAYKPYTADHVLSALQLLAGTAVAFWWFIPKLGGERTVSLDTDWFYRVPLAALGVRVLGVVREGGRAAGEVGWILVERVKGFFANPLLPWFRLRPPEHLSVRERKLFLEKPWNEFVYRFPVGATVLGMVAAFALLGIKLLF